MHKALIISAAICLSACGDGTKEKTAIISTPQGPVQGVKTESGFDNFKGLPFAAPPVGNLRWRAG